MHPEIEKLIDLAIADGQITEKERNVILKKARELGIDEDEVEMTLDGKLHQLEASKPKQKENVGNIKTCPACGASIKSFQVNCKDCGHEFSNVKNNHSISILLHKINSLKKEADETSIDHEKKIANLINSTPIPVTIEDLLEFLSVCCSQADVDFTARGTGIVESAWANKGNEALLKAKIVYKRDADSEALLNDFEKKLKNSAKKSKMIWIVILFMFTMIGGFIFVIEYFKK